MKQPVIRILRSGEGDWEGLYVDGKLLAEGHSIDLIDAVKLLLPNCNFGIVWDDNNKLLELIETGRCPLKWTDELEKLRVLK